MKGLGTALGGGGPVGIAWEIGVLAGLADAIAFDANDARVIVGTSAGSVVGTLVRQGAGPDEWVRRLALLAAPLEPDMEAVGALFPLTADASLPERELLEKVAAIAVSARTQPVEPLLATVGEALGAEWPRGDLRITAVDCDSCELRVWTAGDGVALDRAVTSSIAVPGIIGPVPVAGRRYMDGGMRSPSNADLLAGTGIARALFIGPIGGEVMAGTRPDVLLQRERSRLEAEGVPLFRIVPGEGFRPFAAELMNSAHVPAAFQAGRADGRGAGSGLREFLDA